MSAGPGHCSFCQRAPVYGAGLILRPPHAIYPTAPAISVPLPGLVFCKYHRHRVTVGNLVTAVLWTCIERRCQARGMLPPDPETARIEFVVLARAGAGGLPSA